MQRGLDLPAVQIEDSVGAAVREMLDDESSILQTVQDPDTDSTRVEDVLRAARTWSRLVQSEVEKTAALATLVDRLDLKCDGMRISIKTSAHASRFRSILPSRCRSL
jgi:hypothetical protein